VRKFSKLDTTSVRLYFRPADTTLVVDRDGDGVCDDAKTEDALTKVFELRPVPLAGTPFYGSEDGDAVDPSMGSCPYADPPATVPPIQLCQGQLSDLTFVASQSYGSGAETALYAPLASPGLTCTGDTVELSNLLPQGYAGWICVAAVGRDRVGNRGVSKPLAICAGGACVGAAPPCTESCEPLEIEEGERIIRAL